MREEKRVVTLSDFQHNILINGMNEFRNTLLENKQPTEDVDELLLHIIDAPTKREFKKYSHDER